MGDGSSSRTALACRRCNARKVKCIALAGPPCAGCRQAGVECVLIDSQRGKYPRRRRQREAHSPESTGSSLAQDGRREQQPQSAGGRPGAEAARRRGSSTQLTPSSTTDSPETFYAQIAQQSLSNETTPPRHGQTVFLGEAFSLTYVLQDVLAPFLADSVHFKRRLHFPLLVNRPSPSRQQIVAKQVEHLKKLEVWSCPSQPLLDKLLACYFDHFHPAFPIHCRQQFMTAVSLGEASLLVFYSILMVSVTICPNELIKATDAGNRNALRRLYYKQARALYDADLEPNKYDCVAGVFLMSFWWDGPDDQKDSWHWLGIAASFAQAMGMHRSMRNPDHNEAEARAWRRMWWSIRIRDTLVSGSIGRPQHFSDLACDVELLSAEDVHEALGDDDTEKILYAPEMAKLSLIFSRMLDSRYAASGIAANTQERASLEASLDHFRDNIPAGLRYNGVSEHARGIWSASISMALNYATILLCRPPRSIHGLEQTAQWGNTQKAIASANEITRIMEDILSVSVVRLCQIHFIPAMFNAMAMHIWSLSTSSGVSRELAENRCRICMLGMGVMQESWPVGGWVYQLFAHIMQKLEAKLESMNSSHGGPASESVTLGAHASRDMGGEHQVATTGPHPTPPEVIGDLSTARREPSNWLRPDDQWMQFDMQPDLMPFDFNSDMFAFGVPGQVGMLDQSQLYAYVGNENPGSHLPHPQN